MVVISDEALAGLIAEQLVVIANRTRAHLGEPLRYPATFEEAMARHRVGVDDVPIFSPALREAFDALDLNVARTALAHPYMGKERGPDTAATKAAGYRHGSIGWSQAQQAWYWRVAAHPGVRRICEVGFNAGHSAALWLTANPTATLETFDLFSNSTMASMVANLKLLDERWPGRIRWHKGDSLTTVPKARLEGKCDLVHVDGKHDYQHTVMDTVNLLLKSEPSALYLFDDQCDVNDCKGHNAPVAARPAMATCDLVRAGILAPVAAMYSGDRQFALYRRGSWQPAHNLSADREGRYVVRHSDRLLPCDRCALRFTEPQRRDWPRNYAGRIERDTNLDQLLFRGGRGGGEGGGEK